MEDLAQYTPTELLKLVNDNNVKHESLRLEVIYYTHEIDNLEQIINEKLKVIDQLEKNYIALIEEMDKR